MGLSAAGGLRSDAPAGDRAERMALAGRGLQGFIFARGVIDFGGRGAY